MLRDPPYRGPQGPSAVYKIMALSMVTMVVDSRGRTTVFTPETMVCAHRSEPWNLIQGVGI